MQPGLVCPETCPLLPLQPHPIEQQQVPHMDVNTVAAGTMRQQGIRE